MKVRSLGSTQVLHHMGLFCALWHLSDAGRANWCCCSPRIGLLVPHVRRIEIGLQFQAFRRQLALEEEEQPDTRPQRCGEERIKGEREGVASITGQNQTIKKASAFGSIAVKWQRKGPT